MGRSNLGQTRLLSFQIARSNRIRKFSNRIDRSIFFLLQLGQEKAKYKKEKKKEEEEKEEVRRKKEMEEFASWSVTELVAFDYTLLD